MAAAAAAAIVPPAVAAAAAANVPVFSLTPAEQHTAAFIDLGTTEGRKMFSTATKPLDEPYDGSKNGMHMFLHQVNTRADICGWTTTIMTIPAPTAANPNATFSLLHQYGQLTLAHIEAHALTYQGQPTKAAQDANAMKLFLASSLTKTLMMRVLAKKSSYTFNDIMNGPAMLRVILQLVGIETTASVAVINATLRTMPTKLHELKNDIVKFNEFVTEQCNELVTRGHPPHDILHLLFEAYRTAGNSEFTEYIRAKQSAVYDGTLVIDYQDLMTTAEEKYKIMVITGDWKGTKATPTTDDHIIALQAQIVALQNKVGKPAAKKTGTKNVLDRRNNTGKWSWKEKAPKANESQFHTFEGRKYVHCPHHANTKWVLAENHADGCKIDAKWTYPTEANAEDKLTYAHALLHVVENCNDEDDDASEENL